jgi:hypothetical protein
VFHRVTDFESNVFCGVTPCRCVLGAYTFYTNGGRNKNLADKAHSGYGTNADEKSAHQVGHFVLCHHFYPEDGSKNILETLLRA